MIRIRWWSVICLSLLMGGISTGGADPPKRSMTFMDILNLRAVKEGVYSPDGSRFLYTVSVPHWKSAKSYTDIYLTSTEKIEVRQMTFTKERNEHQIQWAPDNVTFTFLSNRSHSNQIYFMRSDGGEARRLTEEEEGVSWYTWSDDGRYIAYTAGQEDNRQLFLIDMENFKMEQRTQNHTPVLQWTWGPDSRTIYYTTPDSVDRADRERRKKKFDVMIADQPKIPIHLWSLSIEDKVEKRLTAGDAFSIESFIISKDGTKIAFRGSSLHRFAGNPNTELYLLDVASTEITRLTSNKVAERQYMFSPDSRWFAFTAPDQYEIARNTKIYLVPLETGEVQKQVHDFDFETNDIFWSFDSKRICFTSEVGVENQLFSVDAASGRLSDHIKLPGRFTIWPNKKSGQYLLRYDDPHTPQDFYMTGSSGFDDKSKWKRLTFVNPRIEDIALGAYEAIRWKSSDQHAVEGLLVLPVGYDPERQYPLIVFIHGGPASAEVYRFPGYWGRYFHIYAGMGYAVFLPNYRGSKGYGENFRMEISGDYFRQAFDDIMTGIDYLIDRKIAHPDSLGMLGWSAGGHWSNWTLVSTDRFKAISTGAGAVNWISLYAQTDVQGIREFYFQGRPYDNWSHYVDVSPLRYIQNAKTPTLIHFGEADRRIPKPQGDELHMALKKLSVPTEYIVYPGMPHSLTNPRYQLVKMQADVSWFEKWIRGRDTWLDWNEIIGTLGTEEKEE